MQLPSPPSSVTSGPSRQPSPPFQIVQQQDQPDMFLQLLQGPVVSVQVGSGHNVARYNLPAALFCYHSHLFRQEISHYKIARARLRANKKRKISPHEDPSTTRIKAEDSESATETGSSDDGRCAEDETVVKLPSVDPFIFGLFLKFVYTGYYPAAVDARPEATRSVMHGNKSTQPDTPYTPARASMPPPANISSQQAPPGGPLPYLPVLASNISTISLEDSCHHVPIPPSVHAYMLSVQLGASNFLNQAINHIYYGIGKHFVLGPDLSTLHLVKYCSTRVLLWNDLLDLHRDLRHEFTMGLQGVRKVLPVQAYFVDTCVPKVPAMSESKEPDVRVVNPASTHDPSAVKAAATVAVKEPEIDNDQKKG